MALRSLIGGLTAAGLSGPVSAAKLGTATAPAIPWLRIATAFGLCIALAIAAILVVRNLQRGQGVAGLFRHHSGLSGRPGRQIEILETRRISQHADVCLLRCDSTRYLVAASQGTIVLLDKLADDEGQTAS